MARGPPRPTGTGVRRSSPQRPTAAPTPASPPSSPHWPIPPPDAAPCDGPRPRVPDPVCRDIVRFLTPHAVVGAAPALIGDHDLPDGVWTTPDPEGVGEAVAVLASLPADEAAVVLGLDLHGGRAQSLLAAVGRLGRDVTVHLCSAVRVEEAWPCDAAALAVQAARLWGPRVMRAARGLAVATAAFPCVGPAARYTARVLALTADAHAVPQRTGRPAKSAPRPPRLPATLCPSSTRRRSAHTCAAPVSASPAIPTHGGPCGTSGPASSRQARMRQMWCRCTRFRGGRPALWTRSAQLWPRCRRAFLTSWRWRGPLRTQTVRCSAPYHPAACPTSWRHGSTPASMATRRWTGPAKRSSSAIARPA